MVQWHHSAWMSTIRNEYAPNGGKFYVDRPPIPIWKSARNILILLAVAGVVAYFLNSQIGLARWQVFVIVVGFSLFYRSAMFFGAPTTYIVTASGIAIYFAPTNLDYRVFIKFDEVSRYERCGFQKDKGWDCFARTRAEDGLLLIPKNPNGLTKRIEKLFIAPGNIDKFMAQLPKI